MLCPHCSENVAVMSNGRCPGCFSTLEKTPDVLEEEMTTQEHSTGRDDVACNRQETNSDALSTEKEEEQARRVYSQTIGEADTNVAGKTQTQTSLSVVSFVVTCLVFWILYVRIHGKTPGFVTGWVYAPVLFLIWGIVQGCLSALAACIRNREQEK